MHRPRYRRTRASAVLSMLVAAFALAAMALPASAVDPSNAAREAAAVARGGLASRLGTQGVLQLDPVTGTARVVARLDGFLTGPSDASARDVALGFVRDNLAALGLSSDDLRRLVLVRDYVDILGTHHLLWQQRVRGVPVFGNDLRANVAADGRLINVLGSPVHDLSVASTRPAVDAAAAVTIARRAAGARVATPGRVTRSSSAARMTTRFSSGDQAQLVLFATGRGTSLAWQTIAHGKRGAWFATVVDARAGRVLFRQSLTDDAVGTASAWSRNPSSAVPNGGNVQNPVAFPVDDGTALNGPNAHVFLDAQDDTAPDASDDIPAVSGLDWSTPAQLDTSDTTQSCSALTPCSWDRTVPFSWQTNLTQAAAQLYYFLNAFHDHLAAAPIGFTAAAGNFEGDNEVWGNLDDGADTKSGLPDSFHRNNANFSTFPAAAPVCVTATTCTGGIMQMYLWALASQGWASTNGSDDADVVYHEYTHGLSNRLVTFSTGIGAVGSAQAGAMGEAWSDWYAMDFLANQGYVVDGPGAGDVLLGSYVTGGQGIRSEGIDCPVGASASVCPGVSGAGSGGYTYGDFGDIGGDGPEVHADGEIWAQTLWDLRTALGSDKAETVVTRGMELSPPEPSFLDMRNAILQADQVAYAGADSATIWTVFANRGMGFFAGATNGSDTSPVEDFSQPPVCPTDCGTLSGTVTDSLTGTPVDGVVVGIAGHVGGVPDLSATTDASGSFSIADVPFHDYQVVITGPGYEPKAVGLTVDGDETVDLHAVRDWAALDGGAQLVSFTKPDYSLYGCGPDGALDGSLAVGWGSVLPNKKIDGRSIVVKLPASVNVKSFGVASAGTCGDDNSAGVKGFTVETKRTGGKWVLAVDNRKGFPLEQLVTFRPDAGKKKVRFVRFTMISARGNPFFVDMLEFSVRGRG